MPAAAPACACNKVGPHIGLLESQAWPGTGVNMTIIRLCAANSLESGIGTGSNIGLSAEHSGICILDSHSIDRI